MSVINNPRYVRFWALSWTITHHFGVPKRFPLLSNPKVCLRVGRQDSKFGPILARFLDYYLVLGPEVISTTNEPLGAFTYSSSTLTNLANFGLFRGQLLTVLGSRSDFHDCRTSGCVYMWSSILSISANSGPFRALLLTVLGSPSDFYSRSTPRCAYVSFVNTRSFGRF